MRQAGGHFSDRCQAVGEIELLLLFSFAGNIGKNEQFAFLVHFYDDAVNYFFEVLRLIPEFQIIDFTFFAFNCLVKIEKLVCRQYFV